MVTTARRSAAPRAAVVARPGLQAPPARPFLMFINLVPDEAFKHVVIAPLDAPDGARYVTPLQCNRVYYAGTRGLCLTAATDAGAPSYVARVFDEQFAKLHTMTLTGPPSRTRLSPDGRRAAFTVFDEGHSYADGVLSTRTRSSTPSAARRSASSRAGKVDPQRRAVLATGLQLLGRDLRAGRRHVLRDAAHAGERLPHRRQRRDTRGTGSDARRRMSVAVAGPNPHRLQEAARRLAAAGGSCRSSTARRSGTALAAIPRAWTIRSSGSTQPTHHFRPNADGNIIWRLRVDGGGSPQPFVREGFSRRSCDKRNLSSSCIYYLIGTASDNAPTHLSGCWCAERSPA